MTSGSGPYWFGPTVPRRKPSSTSSASPNTVNGTAMASDSMLGSSSVPASPSTLSRSSTASAPKKMTNSQTGRSRSWARFSAMANSG